MMTRNSPNKKKVGHRQKLRENFLVGEKNSYNEEMLLELILTYAIPRRNVQPLARALIARFGNLSAVLSAPFESLCQVDGIKSNTAVLLKLIDCIRIHHRPKNTGRAVLNKPVSRKSTRLKQSGTQLRLFDTLNSDTITAIVGEQEGKCIKKISSRKGTGIFTKAVLKEAISLLPELPETESLAEVRKYLSTRLHQNAEQTRRRYASYITCRMFPEGYADQALRQFAKAYRNTQALRDVCFYRFLKAESLEVQVVKEVLLPNLGAGEVMRAKIKKYVAEKYPHTRSINKCTQGIVDALAAAGIAKVERTKVIIYPRDIPLAAFAFILHSEFQEPGMYDFSELESNRTIQSMLWDMSKIIPSLYELRNRRIISNVSVIDNIRQFTTKWTLERVVEHLVGGEETR